jgi:hypothetical protein
MLYVCEKCGCVDEFEVTYPEVTRSPLSVKPLLCSGCKPGSQWHGLFEQKKYDPAMDNVFNRANALNVSLS